MRIGNYENNRKMYKLNPGCLVCYIQWLLSGSMDTRSMLPREFPAILLVPTVEWTLVLSMPNGIFCRCIVPNCIYHSAMDCRWMAHFLILRCPHRHPFHFLTLQQRKIVAQLDTRISDETEITNVSHDVNHRIRLNWKKQIHCN